VTVPAVDAADPGRKSRDDHGAPERRRGNAAASRQTQPKRTVHYKFKSTKKNAQRRGNMPGRSAKTLGAVPARQRGGTDTITLSKNAVCAERVHPRLTAGGWRNSGRRRN